MLELIEERILVLAPIGKDSELATKVLRNAGLGAVECSSLEEVVSSMNEGCGALLLAEEALAPESISSLIKSLKRQPAWSDIPIILLTSGGTVTQTSKRAMDLLGPHANVTVLERPARVMTLTSTAHAALRARRRQVEVRDLIEQREEMLASIRDAFAMIDRHFRYTYVNEKACRLARMPSEDLLGNCLWDLVPGAVGSELESRLRRAMADRAAVNFEWHCEPWKRWFSIRVYPSKDGLALLAVEITERKRMEAVLRESEHRLHLALDTSKLGTWYWDLPVNRLSWDQSCRRHFGIGPEEEISLDRFYELLHPEDREPTRAAVEKCVAECASFDVEYRVILRDESIRWVHAIGRVFCDEEGSPYRFDGVTIDITDRKTTELELQRAREEALEANRAKDQFLAALSHELRTPLNPVLMTVVALQSDPDVSPILRKDLEMIHRQVELEARLIDDLLDLTRVTRGKLILNREQVDIHELVHLAIETCCNPEVMQKDLHVTYDFDAGKHHVFADPGRIQQVLWNLLNNAVKFTAPGGSIELRTTNPAPGEIELRVKDTGIGVEPELMPRLFDAFQQGGRGITRRFGGLGLGLAISQAIMGLHEGTLTVESDGPGKGATFILRLATSAPADIRARAQKPSTPTPARTLDVLLVEDHQPTREVLARLFKKAGHRVHVAGTVSEALKLAARNPLNLVVSDLGLPDSSGLDLMRELRTLYGLPGIALSGYGMEEDVQASTAAGFDAHLTKPVDWRRLETAMAPFTR